MAPTLIIAWATRKKKAFDMPAVTLNSIHFPTTLQITSTPSRMERGWDAAMDGTGAGAGKGQDRQVNHLAEMDD